VDVSRRKERLRRELASRRSRVSAADSEEAGRRVAARVAELPGFGGCRRLALYAAVRGELSLAALAGLAEAQGLPLLWPRVVADRLEFVDATPGELEVGTFGVPEPPVGRAPVSLAAGDWVVVPGLAFDAAGRRLGRGGGFYDRALAGCAEPVRVGVGYDFQCVDEVPAGPHDQPVDWVVTEGRVLEVRRANREDP
jgi:5-formyltetrahydrofolate cyclo-ligase